METIHGLFEEQAKQSPENIAAICDDQSISYQQLNETANQLAHYLREKGAQPNTSIAICMERSNHLLSVILGILKAGASYTPLDPSHPEARLFFTLNDNNTPIVITTSKLKSRFSGYQGQLIVLEDKNTEISKQSTHNLNSVNTAQDLAYVIYTSGSTGIPKGVLIEHSSVINYCRWFAEYSSCQAQNRIDFSSNYIFDMAVTTTIVPLMLGLTVVICNDEIKKDVRHYLKHLADNQVNIVKITPSYFKVLLHEVKSNHIDLPHLVTIVLGGENLSTADCEAWLDIYPEHILFNEYGPTETTVAVSHYKICHSNLPDLGANVPIGNIDPNLHYYILDANQTPVADGEIGELHVGGICLARQYLNQPELTEQKFIHLSFSENINERLYKTGDLCRLLPDETIEYIGRIDNQVKIRGFRIEPTEIEQTLVAHPAIKDVVVLARKDELNEKLIAYYILKNADVAPNVNQLHQHLATNLPEYMIPTAFVRVEAFPLTANGKLDRQSLPIPRFTTNQHYLAPSNELEKTLSTIWSEELGIKLIGTGDNFFELGGHSLSAARIISKINSTLGKDIILREFYEAATVKKLSTVVLNAKTVDENPAITNPIPYETLSFQPLCDFQLLLWLSNTFEPKAKKINITARKRMQGQIDKTALSFAFNSVFKKHEILLSHTLKLRPAQRLQKNLPFEIKETNISSLSAHENESKLNTSFNELINHYPWQKDSPMIIARLFQMKNEEAELQICMPHIISDDVSPDILFSDLSMFYLHYIKQEIIDEVNPDARYREYQFNEQNTSKERLNRDLIFWEEYLNDASLFSFPSEKVVKNMESTKLPYSTYTKIPEHALNHLQQFCAANYVSISDGLCAALGLALINCCDNVGEDTKNIFMNIVKSTRGNHKYDETIGCFLKLEPIKVTLSKETNLIDLSRQIHRSAIDTAPYQLCSGLVKLACISAFRKKKSVIKSYLIGMLTYLYTKIIPTPNLDHKTLSLCKRLTTLQKTNNFIININVHKSFISSIKKRSKAELFGLKTKKIKSQQYDLLQIDQFFDVCLLRDDNHHYPYIVISANLKPAFRELVAKEMILIIQSETRGIAPDPTSRFEHLVQCETHISIEGNNELR